MIGKVAPAIASRSRAGHKGLARSLLSLRQDWLFISKSITGKGLEMKRTSAVRFMVVLALVSVAIHFIFGWYAAVDEAAAHGESARWSEYIVQWVRDTFENLQSEFWQLAVQFALLAGLFKWLNVQAYEEDQEKVKSELAEIKEMLSQRGA